MTKNNRLTLVGFSHYNKWGQKYNLYKCSCGKEKAISEYFVRNNCTVSCGCARIKHGCSQRSNAYTAWGCMKQRCLNPKAPAYKDYGGRGIAIDERWLDFNVFLEEMGDCPDNHSFARIANIKWRKLENNY